MGGLIVVVVAVAWVAYLASWFASKRDPGYEHATDSQGVAAGDSMRILRDDVLDFSGVGAEVSTPLTRRAELAELQMIARTAARRRRIVLRVLVTATALLTITAALGATAWWLTAIPASLIAIFLGIARFSVVAMHKNLQARADRIIEGWACEATDAIVISDEEKKDSSEQAESSILSDPDLDTENLVDRGSFWDPIPVTTPTYVSQPLVPRTVRTIDLSAPSVPDPVVPTADALEQGEKQGTQVVRPRVVNG